MSGALVVEAIAAGAPVTKGSALEVPYRTAAWPPAPDDYIGTLERFEAAAREVRGDEDVADNVAQHMLHDRTSLLEEKWLGSEQEELDGCVPSFLFQEDTEADGEQICLGAAVYPHEAHDRGRQAGHREWRRLELYEVRLTCA